MSWSATYNNLREIAEPNLSEVDIEYMQSQHPEYLSDFARAFALAKELNLNSVVLTGMRTPNPAGPDEVIDISVRGFAYAPDFQGEMRKIILSGPDAGKTADDHALELTNERARSQGTSNTAHKHGNRAR